MKLSEVRNALNETDRETLVELIEGFGEELVAQYQREGFPLNDMEEAYNGQYRSDEDFAQNLADDLGAVDQNLSWPNNCIDWEYAARELMMDYNEINGHYFRSM